MKAVRSALVLILSVAAVPACTLGGVPAADALNFHLAIESSNAGTRLTNRFTTSGSVPTAEQRALVLRHTRIALEHARMVGDRSLARMHDDMPVMFRSRFERGLELIATGIESRRPDLMADGHRHIEAWADWVESNAASIDFPPRPVVQGE